jgi:hypothetical protein
VVGDESTHGGALVDTLVPDHAPGRRERWPMEAGDHEPASPADGRRSGPTSGAVWAGADQGSLEGFDDPAVDGWLTELELGVAPEQVREAGAKPREAG